MREALTEFLQEVRAAGVAISLAESIDALRAAAFVGIEREPLREALAATVVKDEADRATFDELFDRFFAAPAEGARGKRRRPRAAGEGLQSASGRSAAEDPVAPASRPRTGPRSREPERRLRSGREPRVERELRRRRRRRELLRKPFREMEADEAAELVALAEDLSRRFHARLARRLRRGRRGRLDFRRTLRLSIAQGGAAFHLAWRRRRPARPDLVALCDLSGSVRHAADFFAALLTPSPEFFRRVRLFVYVDRAVEASIEAGRLVPREAVDRYALSDLGRVLVDLEDVWASVFTRSAVVVVLGDARNNRRPARADALSRLRRRVRALWWLVPEPQTRWATGDSAIEAYRPLCDAVLECANGEQLLAALARVARL